MIYRSGENKPVCKRADNSAQQKKDWAVGRFALGLFALICSGPQEKEVCLPGGGQVFWGAFGNSLKR